LRWEEDALVNRLFPKAARKELSRRSFPRQLEPFIRTYPWREIGRHLSERLGLKTLVKNETGVLSVDAVYHSLDHRVARRVQNLEHAISGVYAYDDGALETFRAATQLGLKTLYEHPVIHWRKVRQLQREEAELAPAWACTLRGLTDSDKKRVRKDDEIAAASLVIVASRFSRDSLKLAPGLKAPIEVIPYGCPPPIPRIEPWRSGRLKLIFVGALTQTKGIGYLLEAVRDLADHVELTLIGRRINDDVPSARDLANHTWLPSLPHSEVLSQMEKHHVFILPSLHEGFALVVLEALSRGLMVIVSEHTGAADLITEGKDGFIVPIRSARAIREKLELLLTKRNQLEEMRHAALKSAARYTWPHYQNKLLEAVRKHLQSRPST
jgi:glycosyltransferase involved in cell wall biosynthesis